MFYALALAVFERVLGQGVGGPRAQAGGARGPVSTQSPRASLGIGDRAVKRRRWPAQRGREGSSPRGLLVKGVGVAAAINP